MGNVGREEADRLSPIAPAQHQVLDHASACSRAERGAASRLVAGRRRVSLGATAADRVATTRQERLAVVAATTGYRSSPLHR